MEMAGTKRQQQLTQELTQAFWQNKLSHAYLLVDADQEEALDTAMYVAGLVLTKTPAETAPNATEMARVFSLNHPDLVLINEDANATIGIEPVRLLKKELAKSPVEGTRRIFIINHAENLTIPASNALLNVLEEPVAPVTTFLLTGNQNQILPTIRSRTQILTAENEIDRSQVLVDPVEAETINELVTQLYQELAANKVSKITTVNAIVDFCKAKNLQDFCLQQLLKEAEQHLLAGEFSFNEKLLSQLIALNKMRKSNVSFANCLNYLLITTEF